MSGGLETTFDSLIGARNEAASGVLVDALDCRQRNIRDGALHALLRRRSPSGHKELIRRWRSFDDRYKSIIADNGARISGAVRDAILSPDEEFSACGCDAALWIREYDLIPALINACEDKSNPHPELVGNTLLALAELLYDELAAPRDYQRRRDPQLVRRNVLASLELSAARFEQHKRREVAEAFLLLVNRDNSTLKKILANPHHGAYLTMVDLLTNSDKPGIVRIVLSHLDDPHAPTAALSVLSHRTDLAFLKHLFKKIGYEPSTNAKINLRRTTSLNWMTERLGALAEFDDAQQHGAVQCAVASGVNRLEVFGVLAHIMEHGKPGGRRAASAALAGFRGADANQLIVRALDDEDPQVQANAVMQLRERGIPGAMTRLIESIDSPHEEVRSAARQCLSEFSFKKFLASFDMLDDAVRQSAGSLVKKIDPDTPKLLVAELRAPMRTRRLRALEIAPLIDGVRDVESQIVVLIRDSDHFIRAAAARALAQSSSAAAQQALRDALLDDSVYVRESAEKSLRQLALGGLQPQGVAPLALHGDLSSFPLWGGTAEEEAL